MTDTFALRRYHAPVWDEPVIMELGQPGRRGFAFPRASRDAASLVPPSMRRNTPPSLPELSEFEVLRHYLRLSQQTLGMMGVSLFGTCTMKYNTPLGEFLAGRPELAETHPDQDPETLQGTLSILHDFDLILRELSGMDRFVFQPGGGADAAYTHCCVTRAWLADRGEIGTRDEIITTIQAHPCNAATAAAAGFRVVTLPLEEKGYPSLEALRAAVSPRTAALMVNNPDDMGIYNPDITEWVRVVHEAGGICFYDHANFNGVMGKVRARELGFDACMFMLHKTFGAPKGGGGPAVGAYGCSEALAPYLPGPLVDRTEDGYRLLTPARSAGKVREFWGNVPQVFKAYLWARAMGGDGIHEASDLSVLANNYMDAKLSRIRGVTRSHADNSVPRLEMTRFGLGRMKEETGIGTLDVQNRMTDFGMDAYWLSHEPWVVPEPFTPEAGETYSKEDIDHWIAVIARISDEAYSDPEIVRTAPHNQAIHQLRGEALEDPGRWAMTWRAYLRKSRAGACAMRRDAAE